MPLIHQIAETVEEPEELDTVDWERINTHMSKIYEKNLTNIKYDQHLPACTLVSQMARKEGVSHTSPPSSLPYFTLKGSKKAQIDNSAGLYHECNIKGYVSFLGIPDKENVIEKLMVNGFHSHQVFKSTGILCADVRGLGLTLGVLTLLFDNVSNDRYLVSTR
ncbi:hypothetical protein VP01_3696g1 [Puccinia sorghi]|uniref:Uncharacterized protein n=1 Tax=Puccinia sorghi TaxID=27349 RepID=A0A0L6UU83_9BASI|nr:hypothetical protein VP01_3696g1 [Puccinia sorghi]